MEREQVLTNLLRRDTDINPNILLLKKLLLCVHHGWFRINGLSPEKKYSLADYLLDDERIIFDYTKLSDTSKRKFINWFLDSHRKEAKQAILSGVATNNYRGYTAEVGLSWWGRITNLLYYRKKSNHWYLASQKLLSPDYQLTGLEICEDEHGLLISLNQMNTENTGDKYHQPDDPQENPLRNVKRLFLTDDLVEKMIAADLGKQNYDKLVSDPHPYAIDVNDHEERLQAMQEYRHTQRFYVKRPWYLRLWQWLEKWFEKKTDELEKNLFEDWGVSSSEASRDEEPVNELASVPIMKFKPIIKHDGIKIFRHPVSGKVLVLEKRPDLDTVVFCGGGPKIFGHVGAVKALEEAGIRPKRFAGSSAGAIMATLCYMGYTWQEIHEFFKGFRQEHLIHVDIDRNGISDTDALKSAVDYMILKKIEQIIDTYSIDKAEDRRLFWKFPIDFKTLAELKKRYPDCGLGDELVITATEIKRGITRYFSHQKTPNDEVSKVCSMSACLPVVYKPTLFEGEKYSDGGIKSNLPTEAFCDDYSTLLTSEHGNCLSLLAFQFDNGCERTILDKFVDRVYRENFIWNWIYEKLTGVKDPVSGWERDRIKLQQYSNQAVLISVTLNTENEQGFWRSVYSELKHIGNLVLDWFKERFYALKRGEPIISIGTGSEDDEEKQNKNSPKNLSLLSFDVDPATQNILIDNGYEPTKDYIAARYASPENGMPAVNKEYMYSTFNNLEELLHFTRYRKKEDWTAIISDFMREEQEKSDKGKCRLDDASQLECVCENSVSESNKIRNNMDVFYMIYSVIKDLPSKLLIQDKEDLKKFLTLRHKLAVPNSNDCVDEIIAMKGKIHILFAILQQLLTSLPTTNDPKAFQGAFDDLRELFDNQRLFGGEEFYGEWDLYPRQIERVFKSFKDGSVEDAKELCIAYKNKEEPLQTIIRNPYGNGINNEQRDNSGKNVDHWIIEGYRESFSV
ncbi:Dot/Icm T4SS effector VpdC [Legionella spiritensis]|uniref:Esterase of the alpha-beta hydrolase superfamily protein n=1 Tax=Legionella spiritensis TaxID=452 RepID=A0A0W0Z5A0_LEGSP|nr:Dot/Icm T4SS effector VpdC [Legionella spiritensis]KTD63971.1 esterase of the alpha-beta hydrolase superfamily protein [Legionella spiritensis]SNV36908.1 esterase of the alpha-beta hydrolase superfamily [Legionella spiritensis]